jgi:hypothetical protein
MVAGKVVFITGTGRGPAASPSQALPDAASLPGAIPVPGAVPLPGPEEEPDR